MGFQYRAVKWPDLFREAAKMMLGAFWARFCPSRRIYRRGRRSLNLAYFWPFYAPEYTRTKEAAGKLSDAPGRRSKTAWSNAIQPTFECPLKMTPKRDGWTVGGTVGWTNHFHNTPDSPPPDGSKLLEDCRVFADSTPPFSRFRPENRRGKWLIVGGLCYFCSVIGTTLGIKHAPRRRRLKRI